MSFATSLPALAFAVTVNDPAAIIIASAAFVTAVSTAWVNVMATRETRRETREVKAEVEKNTKLTEEVKGETQTISGHVNSAATAAKALNESQAIQLEMMRATIAKMETAAQLVAQAAAQAAVAKPTMMQQPATPAPKVGEESTTIRKLEAIEKNTEATAENTARTEESAARTEQVIKKANEP